MEFYRTSLFSLPLSLSSSAIKVVFNLEDG